MTRFSYSKSASSFALAALIVTISSTPSIAAPNHTRPKGLHDTAGVEWKTHHEAIRTRPRTGRLRGLRSRAAKRRFESIGVATSLDGKQIAQVRIGDQSWLADKWNGTAYGPASRAPVRLLQGGQSAVVVPKVADGKNVYQLADVATGEISAQRYTAIYEPPTLEASSKSLAKMDPATVIGVREHNGRDAYVMIDAVNRTEVGRPLPLLRFSGSGLVVGSDGKDFFIVDRGTGRVISDRFRGPLVDRIQGAQVGLFVRIDNNWHQIQKTGGQTYYVSPEPSVEFDPQGAPIVPASQLPRQ